MDVYFRQAPAAAKSFRRNFYGTPLYFLAVLLTLAEQRF
jgi:hypothetical protein